MLQDVTIYQSPHKELEYSIGDELSFISFIMDLRRVLADRSGHEDILDRHCSSNLSSAREHQLLAKRHADQPPNYLDIKLQVAGEATWTTLVVRDDNVDVLGFKNQNRVCYELGGSWRLHSVLVGWGVSYTSILDARNQEEVANKLDSARLGRGFAMEAVRALSRYRPAADVADGISPRLALAGLSVMFCQSAKMNPLRDNFARGWSTGAAFTKQLMDYMLNWERISSALLDWKDRGYQGWIKDQGLEGIGIRSPIDALGVIHLVRNRLPIED